MDFLFHKLSEKEKEDIKKQVKINLNSFSKKLATLKENTKIEEGIEREKCEREESENIIHELDKKIMFKNAPDKNEDCIIAEKKKW